MTEKFTDATGEGEIVARIAGPRSEQRLGPEHAETDVGGFGPLL